MATDGVKIIDGDTAHDTYWGIMDLYDSGCDLADIERKYPLDNGDDSYDDFDDEIYVTSCGLAYWEIGLMTPSRLEFIRAVIDKGAGVEEWNRYSEKEGKARQRVLNSYWQKISQPNAKIRARKKYRKITNFHFQPDDLLTFQLSDGHYVVAICATIDQYRGKCHYMLVPTTYYNTQKPVLSDLYSRDILGHRIGSGFPPEEIIAMQPGIERVWNYVGGKTNFFCGVYKLGVDHKDLAAFSQRLEKIGTLQIVEGLKETGILGYESSFEELEASFFRIKKDIDAEKLGIYDKWPVSVLCNIES